VKRPRGFLIILVALFGGMVFASCGNVELEQTPTSLPADAATETPAPAEVPDTPTPVPTEMPTPTPTAIPPTDTPPTEPTPAPALPTAFPDPARYEWRAFASGLSNPIGLANAGDGSGRLFVLEQAGLVRIIREGELLGEPFLDISAQISCCGERGLLGLAFHPNYTENGFFYVNYTDLNGNTSISRFQVSDDPDRADPGTEVRLLGVEQPFRNHNGGAVEFGPDGYLYLGLGDGGSGGDPLNNGQNTDALLGKILRIDVDGGEPYGIPADNPFTGGGGAPEVWAYGLRNPWRITFDRQTSDFYIADVGQNQWEEINFLPAGSAGGVNFGWNYLEGSHSFLSGAAIPEGLVNPVAEYEHSLGCSVTGGLVYRGEQLPEWQGIYLYGDYCSGLVWGLFRIEDGAWQDQLLFETGASIASFGEDETGEVYFADRQGTVFLLVGR
jgi:glucose/arabinose dehydrogenase